MLNYMTLGFRDSKNNSQAKITCRKVKACFTLKQKVAFSQKFDFQNIM